ncbi:MAG: TraB/GumN family protein [Steroidobacteraceae bacterium]
MNSRRLRIGYSPVLTAILLISTPALAQLDSLLGPADSRVAAMTDADRTTAAAAQAEAIAALDEVVITGEQPGPALWQVRKGEHVLWILGTVAMLPKEVTWNTQPLEQLMNRVNALLPESAELNIGVLSLLMHPINLTHSVMLPGSKTLQQVLSADSYMQFNRLRMQYAPDEKMLDRTRPMPALIELQGRAARNEQKLTTASIARSVIKMAEQNHIKVSK